MASDFAGRRVQALQELKHMLQSCMQCGSCSASCPNSAYMDYAPRKLWRLVLLEDFDTVFASHTFWLCSNCYTCTLRCARGLSLTWAVNRLKRLAPRQTFAQKREAAFYDVFMESVRKYGRVQETNMIMHYFWVMKDPRLPLKYTPLGSKLLWKGKIHPVPALKKAPDKLGQIFAKAQELEGK